MEKLKGGQKDLKGPADNYHFWLNGSLKGGQTDLKGPADNCHFWLNGDTKEWAEEP